MASVITTSAPSFGFAPTPAPKNTSTPIHLTLILPIQNMMMDATRTFGVALASGFIFFGLVTNAIVVANTQKAEKLYRASSSTFAMMIDIAQFLGLSSLLNVNPGQSYIDFAAGFLWTNGIFRSGLQDIIFNDADYTGAAASVILNTQHFPSEIFAAIMFIYLGFVVISAVGIAFLWYCKIRNKPKVR